MAEIDRIVYVEDSDDEMFLARIVLGRARLVPTLVHYPRSDALERDVSDGRLVDPGACLFVVDLNLKLSKGTDAIRRLRTMPQGRDVLIGVCTGSQDPADRRDACEAGSNFFVGKPLDAACLARICDSVATLELTRTPDGALSIVRS